MIVFATRPSTLARWQTRWVISALEKAWPGIECDEKVITTQGDQILDRPLPEIGGKGLFTLELEAELVSGRLQAAVHSLKDLPVDETRGLTVGAIPARGEVRDVLISYQGQRLNELPAGARVGTSSLRRQAQVLALRPDLEVLSMRGNVETRIRKLKEGQYDAIILAGAGVTRLSLEAEITEYLPLEVMLPAPGQGALAVQCRTVDAETLKALAAIEDEATRQTTLAERSFLSCLGGGCSAPVAAYASFKYGEVELQGLVASADGQRMIRVRHSGDYRWVGIEAAHQALALGAGELLHA